MVNGDSTRHHSKHEAALLSDPAHHLSVLETEISMTHFCELLASKVSFADLVESFKELFCCLFLVTFVFFEESYDRTITSAGNPDVTEHKVATMINRHIDHLSDNVQMFVWSHLISSIGATNNQWRKSMIEHKLIVIPIVYRLIVESLVALIFKKDFVNFLNQCLIAFCFLSIIGEIIVVMAIQVFIFTILIVQDSFSLNQFKEDGFCP